MSNSSVHPIILKNVAGISVASITSPKLGPEVRDALFKLVDNDTAKKVIINFHNVQILSSAPIGTLVNLRNILQSSGGSLALCQLDPYIREILQLTGVENLFSIFETEQDAIDSLAAV